MVKSVVKRLIIIIMRCDIMEVINVESIFMSMLSKV